MFEHQCSIFSCVATINEAFDIGIEPVHKIRPWMEGNVQQNERKFNGNNTHKK